MVAEHGQEIVDGPERRRQVGVEEPHERRVLGQPHEDAGTHRGGLAAARRVPQRGYRRRRPRPHALEDFRRGVVTPIVDHHEPHARVCREELEERLGVEPGRLVVAGHDQG